MIKQRHDMTKPSEVMCDKLSWGLCIATLDRLDSLEICVRCALAQTRKISEIVVVDASTDWENNRDHISGMLSGDTNIRLVYIAAKMRSLTNQRNQAIAAATVDVLFMIDDDSYLYPDAAERALQTYETPNADRLVALSLSRTDRPPKTASDGATPDRKDGADNRETAEKVAMKSPILRWIYREVFMMHMDKDFISYDDDKSHGTRAEFESLNLIDTGFTRFIAGYALTVRRNIAVKEMFEPTFLSYCPGEDLDATYRYGRHGVLGWSSSAKVFHADAAAGRIKRKRATTLRALNLAYLLRRHSKWPAHSAAQYSIYLLRRVLAEFLKDLLSGRLTFPQFRGVLRAIKDSPSLWMKPKSSLEDWYIDLQKQVLQS